MSKELNQAQKEALLRLLQARRGTAAELILRLAWQAGLNRTQIHALTWGQVDFAQGEIRLTSHTVPLSQELAACLAQRQQRGGKNSGNFVVLTDARGAHPHSVIISKMASEALGTEEALKGITLKELRDDFIIRMLTRHGKDYTLQVSGIAVATLYASFNQYLSQSHGTVTEGAPSPKIRIDTKQLMDFLAAEGTSPAAMGIWLAWKQNLSLQETVSLTWAQVEEERGYLTLPGRKVPLHPIVAQLLAELRQGRQEGETHVLLTPNAKTPFRAERLSVVIRTALCRSGLGAIHLDALHTLDQQQQTEETVLQYAAAKGHITRKEAETLLGVNENAAYKTLNLLVQQEKLVRVGSRYYIAGTVVPPQEHRAAIERYLGEVGASTSGDIARMLRIEPRACSWILRSMVEEGALTRSGQIYKLPKK